MNIEHFIFSDAPQRVGPFSHAVGAGEFLFVTGQMPTLKDDKSVLVSGGIEAQTTQVMENLDIETKQFINCLDMALRPRDVLHGIISIEEVAY